MSEQIVLKDPYFTFFQESVVTYPLPLRFTFPFYYEPHPLCLIAASELQKHLEDQKEWDHNFGIDGTKDGMVIGKMFGVLIVENQNGEIGYLSAFSGKLAGENHHSRFVPPVFDMLTEDGFFRKEEEVLNHYNRQIELLENAPELAQLYELLATETNSASLQLTELKQQMKEAKQARDLKRKIHEAELSENELTNALEELRKESINESFYLKHFNKQIKNQLAAIQHKIDAKVNEIVSLKEERRHKSASLQQKLFDQYYFLNQYGEKKSLQRIFQNSAEARPPAGAGECAAPKLLQYAFLHDLKPLAMAEFWWGQSPKSEVRIHGQFYPACRGKCEPILAHMLHGIEMDENPMLINPAEGKDISIVYEDEELAVINKPAEFLSVPGKNVKDSVYERVRTLYPEASGPLIVHRLDMSTSGLMLIAKSEETYKYLQSQFINRTVKKRYVALLEGVVQHEEGVITLPLRVDLDNRPHQLVCYEYGKPATTKWNVVERTDKYTRIHFYPITGRTHQLRVHSAHKLGLNSPIVGDDLYGSKGDRLHLHAEMIEFKHPVSKKTIVIQVDAEF
ncbi:RluA family pseudouridine synthase [Solitalea lacus]|uniref:RluA family pseudouridine synthase n=1 Tax=Solitalea lacus TaxID=2911172 RepID=UPI001EDA47D4|nr:RluA family pseudouridine synthase [Solitalea lacus]UKJ08100.1 pseudouridine synthase [Solitalea lacus]